MPVALHDGRTLDEKLARHAAREFRSVGVGDDDLKSLHGHADGAGTIVARRVHRDDGRRLGEPVDLVDREAELLAVGGGNLLRQSRAADACQAQTLEIFCLCLAREDGADGRHGVHDGDLLFADGADRLLGHEAVDDDDRAAGCERRKDGARPGEAVVHGQDAEHLVVRRDGVMLHDLMRVDALVLVTEHGALGCARRARCVDDDAGVFGREDARKLRRGHGARGFHDVEQGQLAKLAAVSLLSEVGFERQLLFRHEAAHVRVLDDVGDFAFAELVVERNGDSAERVHGEVGDEQFDAVVGKERDVVVRTDSGGVEAVARGAKGFAQFVVGDAAAAVDDGDVFAASVLQDFVQ